MSRFGRRANFKLAELDPLGRLTQEAIDALHPRRRIDARYVRYEGWCARACEAYVFLAKDGRTAWLARDRSAEPRFVKHSRERGDSHYFLEGVGGFMDLNFGPHDPPDPRYCRYDEGQYPTRTRGFQPWPNDPKYPDSAEAREIMDAVWGRIAGGQHQA